MGNKFGNLLGGLLGGLYAGSSSEADPSFLPPGQEGPAGANGNQPFKSGGGLFGGIKAKQENTDYRMHDMLAAGNANRQLQNQIKIIPYQNEQQKTQLADQLQLKSAEENRKLGEEGQTTGQFLGNLPTEQLSNIVPPTQTFSSPQEQQRYISSVYGDKTNLNDLPIMADPRTKSANQSKAIGAGLVELGTTKANLDTNTAYTGASVQHTQEIIPITKKVMNFETGAVEDQVVGYKTVSTPVSIPAGINNLADMRMSPETVAATAQVQPGGDFNTTDYPPANNSGISAKPSIDNTAPFNYGTPSKVAFPRVMPGRSSGGKLQGLDNSTLPVNEPDKDALIKRLNLILHGLDRY